MNWLTRNSLLALFILPVTLLAGAQSFVSIPTADLLEHAQYQIQGKLGYSKIEDNGSKIVYPYYTGVFFGLFDLGEVGVEYGKELSLSGMAQFYREDKYMPSITVGGRGVFGSQEAHLFNVPDSNREKYQGDIFAVLSKSFFPGTRIHGGISVISALDSGRVSPFVGIEQQLGWDFSLTHEVFHRNSSWHQNTGLCWRYSDILAIAVGFLETQHWFYQDKQIGFYPSPAKKRPDSWSSPGIYLSIQANGRMQEKRTVTIAGRVSDLEGKVTQNNLRTEDLLARMDRVETQLIDLVGPKADSIKKVELQVEKYLKVIISRFDSEVYDIEDVALYQDSILALGEPANRALVRFVDRESTDKRFKENSIRVMAGSRNSRFIPVLLRVLEGKNKDLRKEALIALGEIGDYTVINRIKQYKKDPQTNIAETASQVIEMLEEIKAETEGTTIEQVPEKAVEKTEEIVPTENDQKLNGAMMKKLKELEVKIKMLEQSTGADLGTMPSQMENENPIESP